MSHRQGCVPRLVVGTVIFKPGLPSLLNYMLLLLDRLGRQTLTSFSSGWYSSEQPSPLDGTGTNYKK